MLVVASASAFVVPRRGLARVARPRDLPVVLASFLLVDLGSPQFEAILFAVLACSFYLLESFVDDLEDPFGGSWTVDAALDACDELVDALAVEE